MSSAKFLVAYCLLRCKEFIREDSTYQIKMPATVVESSLFAPVTVRGDGKKDVQENGDNLDEVVDKMISVKLAEDVDPERVIKHPLQHAWTLWFFQYDRSKSWEENQRRVLSVTTVEDFWALHHHVEGPAGLPVGCDYSLFKEGIIPDWEDARNVPGGRWLLTVDRRQRSELLDNLWLEILLFLIGEGADPHASQVNGAAVNVRGKGDKLAVWLADASKPDSVTRIGKMIKERLCIPHAQTIVFNVHSEEKAKTGTSGKAGKWFV